MINFLAECESTGYGKVLENMQILLYRACQREIAATLESKFRIEAPIHALKQDKKDLLALFQQLQPILKRVENVEDGVEADESMVGVRQDEWETEEEEVGSAKSDREIESGEKVDIDVEDISDQEFGSDNEMEHEETEIDEVRSVHPLLECVNYAKHILGHWC